MDLVIQTNLTHLGKLRLSKGKETRSGTQGSCLPLLNPQALGFLSVNKVTGCEGWTEEEK
jgi:hypothetical protein